MISVVEWILVIIGAIGLIVGSIIFTPPVIIISGALVVLGCIFFFIDSENFKKHL